MSQSTILRAATHGAGRANLNRALAHFLPFKTSGALYAEANPVYVSSGRLTNAEDIARLTLDNALRITYVVYSYGTPIAWVANDGEIYTVSQKFSVTTSKHQGTLYAMGRTDLF